MVFFVSVLVLTVKGYLMFFSADNNCKAAHPVGHGYLIFVLIYASFLSLIALATIIKMPVAIVSICQEIQSQKR